MLEFFVENYNMMLVFYRVIDYFRSALDNTSITKLSEIIDSITEQWAKICALIAIYNIYIRIHLVHQLISYIIGIFEMVSYFLKKHFNLDIIKTTSGFFISIYEFVPNFFEIVFESNVQEEEKKQPSSIERPQSKIAKKRRRLTTIQRHELENWIMQNKNNPFPTKSQKEELSMITNLTVDQINQWFAKTRWSIKKKQTTIENVSNEPE